jgi:hypothetical protein
LALHYLWASKTTITTFLTSVRDSLKPQGIFLLTIIDSERIPAEGILNHPYIRITPPKLKSDGIGTAKTYHFSFPGLVENVEEYVVPRDELIAHCASFSLALVDSFNVRDVIEQLWTLHPTKPPLVEHDWLVLDLFRAYAFRRAS